MGLGLVRLVGGDLPAELQGDLEILAAGVGVAEGDAQVAELVAKPGAFAADLDLIGEGRRELVAELDLLAIQRAGPGRVAQPQAGAGEGAEDVRDAALRLVIGRLPGQPLATEGERLVEVLQGGPGVADPVHLEIAESRLDAGLDLQRFERVGFGRGQLLGEFLHPAEVASRLVVLAIFHGDQAGALIDPGERPGGHRESFPVAGHRAELLQGGDRGLEAGQRRVDQLLAESLRPRDREEPLIEQDAEDALRLQGVAILGERPLDQRLGLLARLALLLEGVGLGVPGGDRVVLRERSPPARSSCATSFAAFLLLVGLGEFCVAAPSRTRRTPPTRP